MRRWVQAVAMACLLVPATSVLTDAQQATQPSKTVSVGVDLTSLSDDELLGLLSQLEAARQGARPVTVFGVPSGFGARSGTAFASAALTNRRDRTLDDWDGSLSFGLGFGDPDNRVGVTATVDVTSVSSFHFGSSGKVNLALNRSFPLGSYWRGGVSLGLGNLVRWGDSAKLDRTWTAAFSATGPLTRANGMPVMVSMGYGSGIADRGTKPGAFAGVGLGLRDDLGISVGWYGDEAIAAIALWPGKKKNVQISLGIGDITNEVDGRRFLMSVSVSRPFGRR